jgi:hypothetical protein
MFFRDDFRAAAWPQHAPPLKNPPIPLICH